MREKEQLRLRDKFKATTFWHQAAIVVLGGSLTVLAGWTAAILLDGYEVSLPALLVVLWALGISFPFAVLVPVFIRLPVYNMSSVWKKGTTAFFYVAYIAILGVITLEAVSLNITSNETEKSLFERVLLSLNVATTDVVFHLVAAIVVLIGIWINSKRGELQRRDEQTFKVLFDSRLSDAFQVKLREFNQNYAPGIIVKDKDVELRRLPYSQIMKSRYKDKVAIEAAYYLLNFYEFISRGIRVSELTESILYESVRGIVTNVAEITVPIIEHERTPTRDAGELHANADSVFQDFLWLLVRWDLVNKLEKDEKDRFEELLKTVDFVKPPKYPEPFITSIFDDDATWGSSHKVA